MKTRFALCLLCFSCIPLIAQWLRRRKNGASCFSPSLQSLRSLSAVTRNWKPLPPASASRKGRCGIRRDFSMSATKRLNKIFHVYPDGKKEEVIALGDPDGNTFDRRHRLIDCASVLRAIIEVTPDGKYKVLADRYDGKRLNSPNDVIVGPGWRALLHRSHARSGCRGEAGDSVSRRLSTG